jgi:hypothetical protein
MRFAMASRPPDRTTILLGSRFARRCWRQPNPQSDTVQLNVRAALPFAVLLALFSGAHGIAAKLGWVKSQVTASGRRRIPFAPSVAGALICTLVLRSLPTGIVP